MYRPSVGRGYDESHSGKIKGLGGPVLPRINRSGGLGGRRVFRGLSIPNETRIAQDQPLYPIVTPSQLGIRTVACDANDNHGRDHNQVSAG